MVATRRQPELVGQAVAGAFGRHEAEIERRDPDWPEWYARYVMQDQGGGSSEGSLGART